MKRFLLAAAVVAIAVAILVSLTIQPAQLVLPDPRPDGSVRGVLHVHTDRSDGQASIDEVAAAAADAGLTFVIITDHGDAMATPEGPAYRSGVLCIDAVEISTAGGHVIALDMPVAPYPLAGEPRDVVEDIHRLGGFAVAAHPDSPKTELRWRDWDVPIDGLETLNLDTGWRVWAAWAGWGGDGSVVPAIPGQPGLWRARARLAASLLDYPIRPIETIAGLVPAHLDEKYVALTGTRRVVSLAGADAHARIAFQGDPAGGGPSLPMPGYESTFRTMSVHVKPERDLTGDPVEDAQLLLAAIRAGHVYNALEALATPASIEFTATSDSGSAAEGDEIRTASPVTLRVRSNMGPDFMTAVMNGAKDVKGTFDREFTVDAAGPGAYWVRITSTNPKTLGATWIRTNPIYIRGVEGAPPAPRAPAPAAQAEPLFDGKTNSDWQVEHDPNSQGAVDAANLVDGPSLRFRFGLGGGTPTGPFVGIARQTSNGLAATDRVAFTIRSEQPMRVWLQVRVPAGTDYPSERWQRSLYADQTPRDYSVVMDDLTPAGTTHTLKPAFADIRSLMFVIDTINTKPGASGRVWLSKLRFER